MTESVMIIQEDNVIGEVYTPWYYKLIWLVTNVWGWIVSIQAIQLSSDFTDKVMYLLFIVLVSALYLRLVFIQMIRITYDSKKIKCFMPLKGVVLYNWSYVIGVSAAGVFAFHVNLSNGRSMNFPVRVEGDGEFLAYAKFIIRNRPVDDLKRVSGNVEKLVGYYWVYIALTILVPVLIAIIVDFSDEIMIFYFVLLFISLLMNFPWVIVAREVVVHMDCIEWTTLIGKKDRVYYRSISQIDL